MVPPRQSAAFPPVEGDEKEAAAQSIGNDQIRPDRDVEYGTATTSPEANETSSSNKPQAVSRKSASTLLSRNSTSQTIRERDAKSPIRAQPAPSQQPVTLDPLSTQIYLRTNSNNEPLSISQRLRTPATRTDSTAPPPAADTADRPSQSFDSIRAPNGVVDASKDRSRKGHSFLSRLTMRTPWQRDDDADYSDSELGEVRQEGTNAEALTSLIGDGGGYIPYHKEPTRYIKVRSHNKKGREFNRLFLSQELLGDKEPKDSDSSSREPAIAVGTKILKGGDAIWAAEFSVDGRFLAVAGKDQVVRVFSVISTPEERLEEEEELSREGRTDEKLSAPVFRTKPTREFEGHTGEVLALSWSKNGFLLSSSMDKTVRLWHVSRPECLCTFKHSDLVTSIAFHPTDDRFFLAGSLDAQLRLWSIPDKDVAFAAPTHEFITAVAFSPDGKTAICGVLSGLCMFYETEGLKFLYHIHVRSSRGKNAKGSKITGIRTTKAKPGYGEEEGEVKVLVSSNDSRIRIYSMKTRMLEVKFKGLENSSSQIHARFSDDGNYVVSGSEDRRAYIWNMDLVDIENRDKQPYECFDAHPEVVTTALLAPTETRQLLSRSGDPLYELCNPPPVMLRSLDETASQSATSENPDQSAAARKLEENPAYVERTKHNDGHILITTDRTGTIKVFRQDCAYMKRQQSWETGSRLSGRFSSIGRSASINTRRSSRVNSRRTSLTLNTHGISTERIMSWRQDVEGTGGRSNLAASIRSERSMSPMKPNRSPLSTSTSVLAAEARRQPYKSSSALQPSVAASPTLGHPRSSRKSSMVQGLGSSQPPRPSFSLVSSPISDAQEDKDGSFWNLSRWGRGLSGLRYSTTSSSLAGGTATSNPGAPRKSESATGGRRSMGTSELGKLKTETEAADRRKSMGPGAVASSRSKSTRSAASATTETERGTHPESSRARPPHHDSKQRVDSGVGRLSDETAEEENEDLKCGECGWQSFKIKAANNGKPVQTCAKCGAAA